MCETMGPKTDLGKLLKALNLAATAALLLELSNMTEAELANTIDGLAKMAGGIIGDLDSMFFQGGETLAATIGAIPP